MFIRGVLGKIVSVWIVVIICIQTSNVYKFIVESGTKWSELNKRDPLVLTGRWVHVGRNRTFAASVCCGLDGEFRNHPQECGENTTDVFFHAGYSAENPWHQQICGNACRSETGKAFMDEWIWQAPDLAPFDPHLTCQHLGARTVLILGDSTGQQTAATLMNALKIGGCAPQILFELTDTLIQKDFGVMNRGVHWWDSFQKRQPDIIIMGAGAHIRGNASYSLMLDNIISQIQEWQTQGEIPRKKSVAFVWKTQQPGGCTNTILHPEDPLRAASEFDFSQTPKYKEYSYDEFYSRDTYTIGRWMTELENAHVMDFRMLYSRSDRHPGSGHPGPRDCLHFLSPGPLDVVAPLFQRLLLDITE